MGGNKMKVYCLQIHNTNSTDFDENYIFENFEDMCKEFQNKLNFYKNIGAELRAIEEPTYDEVDNEVHGMFMVLNTDESFSEAKCYDYDVLID